MRNKHGMVIPFFALLLIAVLGLGAITIDLSNFYTKKTNVKSAIDLSVLAGISQLVTNQNISGAKNVTLNYLNNNLTKTIPNFVSLTLDNNDLSIQVGVYDFNNMTFTWDENHPSPNAIMVSYTYKAKTFLGMIFNINEVQIYDKATVAKRAAGKALAGSGFPFVIDSSVLPSAINNGNMLRLYTGSDIDNAHWTDYTNSNPSTTDIKNVIDYFQSGIGTKPPGVTVNDTFNVNDGGMGAVIMDMDPNILVGMTYLFPLVSSTDMASEVMTDGFLGAEINAIVDSMGQKYIDITITPSYVDNTFGGLQVGGGTNISSDYQSLLAQAFGLVE
ncbi:MAG: hypothetical protein HYY52_00255 [Candidatus Melainabacteria bacterium]|nr:hypothetical protein [Candidatus Melainabacteria bacterium]